MDEMETFLWTMPRDVETVEGLAHTIIRDDKSRAHYLEVVAQIEFVAQSLRDFLAYQDSRRSIIHVGNKIN